MRTKRGVTRGTLTVPRWVGSTRATTTDVWVWDYAGNSTHYSATPGSDSTPLTRAMRSTLTIRSGTNAKDPTVGATTLSRSTLAVGDRRWQVDYTVRASDKQSGVSYVRVLLQSQDSAAMQTGYAYLSLKRGVWRGTGVIDCYATPGTYDVVVAAYDRAGNSLTTTKGTATFTAAP
jgi:hypothetical protein